MVKVSQNTSFVSSLTRGFRSVGLCAAVVLLGTATVSTATGCVSGPEKTPDKDRSTLSDGLPKWIDDACVGLPKGTLCAVGESDFAAADVELAKTDAETSAKNRIADQLKTRVGRLTERLASAAKDLSNGRVYGERTLKDINQNFVDQELVGLRYPEYFYYPDRISPKKIYVRATLTVDDAAISQQVVDSMSKAAAAELEVKHEDAQARFDAVRRQYLMEQAGEGGAGE